MIVPFKLEHRGDGVWVVMRGLRDQGPYENAEQAAGVALHVLRQLKQRQPELFDCGRRDEPGQTLLFE